MIRHIVLLLFRINCGLRGACREESHVLISRCEAFQSGVGADRVRLCLVAHRVLGFLRLFDGLLLRALPDLAIVQRTIFGFGKGTGVEVGFRTVSAIEGGLC